MENITDKLDSVLKSVKPENIDEYFRQNEEKLYSSGKPFADYFRQCIRSKGILRQEVFIRADISEGYGYKIVSEEKHTKQRDLILRLCLAARFTMDEIQRALKLYGMSPLYSRMPRDAVLMVAINKGIYEIDEVNDLLKENGMPELKGSDALY